MSPKSFAQLRRRKAIFRTLRSRTDYSGKSGDLLLAIVVLVLVIAALCARWWSN